MLHDPLLSVGFQSPDQGRAAVELPDLQTSRSSGADIG